MKTEFSKAVAIVLAPWPVGLLAWAFAGIEWGLVAFIWVATLTLLYAAIFWKVPR